MNLYKLASVNDIEEGRIYAFDVKDEHIILVKLGNDFYALSGFCTHEKTDLSNGFFIEDRIVCPLHLSQFDCRTGEVINPPATEPLKKFNVKILDGFLYVEV